MAEISKKRTWIWVTIISIVIVGSGIAIGIPLYRNLNPPEPPEVQNIDVHQAKLMIDDNSTYPNLIVVDIRLDYEYFPEHLEDAIWVAWNITTLNYNGNVTQLAGYEDTEIIVYCRTGNRSVAGSQFLLDAGFNKIYNMLGGIEQWKNAGYPVVTS
jgi:rhodanese-related sulfurtransferase